MTHQDIIAQLCQLHPPETIYELTTETVISEIVRRMGEDALELSAEELRIAVQEVRSAIEHHDPARDLIAIGLDAWEIVLNL